jgi:YVTN family beta-propeller protein
VYTANGLSNDVSVLDATTNRVVATIKVGQRPWGAAR